MQMQTNTMDGWLADMRAKMRAKRTAKKAVAVKAVAGKAAKAIPAVTPVTTAPPVSNEVEGFTARYLYPEELIDSPEAWESENFYFGETPTLYMGAALPVDIGAKAKEPSWFEKLFTTAAGIYQQKQALKQAREENVMRAQQGLPPVSTAEIKRQFAPQAAVEVGLSPQIRNMLVIGGLGLGAFMVVNMLRKK